jgi:hypothetical protein
VAHFIFFCLKITDYVSAIHPFSENLGAKDDVQNLILILTLIILFAQVMKIQHLIKIYHEYGLLTELIAGSAKKVIPFLLIFILWTLMFAA